MTSKIVWTMPAAALFVVGGFGMARADTSSVKLPPLVVVAKSGNHCKDDPHCFNRYHYTPSPLSP